MDAADKAAPESDAVGEAATETSSATSPSAGPAVDTGLSSTGPELVPLPVDKSRLSLMPADFTARLRPEEHVKWLGQPDPGRLFEKLDLFLIPWTLCGLLFAIFWEREILATTPLDSTIEISTLFFLLFGTPFILFSLYALGPRFWIKRRMRRRTWYAVTDQRLLIYELFPARRLRGIDWGGVKRVGLNARWDATGTLRFRSAGWRRDLVFVDIDDVREVAKLIERLRGQGNVEKLD